MEQLWTRKVNHPIYEICCIPFFAYMSLGDHVEIDDDDKLKKVVKRSGRQVLRIAIVNEQAAQEIHDALHAFLNENQFLYEFYNAIYVAISIEGDEADKLNFILPMQARGDIVYELIDSSPSGGEESEALGTEKAQNRKGARNRLSLTDALSALRRFLKPF
jgi:hypothetical protein